MKKHDHLYNPPPIDKPSQEPEPGKVIPVPTIDNILVEIGKITLQFSIYVMIKRPLREW